MAIALAACGRDAAPPPASPPSPPQPVATRFVGCAPTTYARYPWHRSGPAVKVEVTSATGFDPAIVRRYLRRHGATIAECFADRPGHVALELAWHADGTVASVTATGLAAETDACVEKAVAPIEFPKPTGPDARASAGLDGVDNDFADAVERSELPWTPYGAGLRPWYSDGVAPAVAHAKDALAAAAPRLEACWQGHASALGSARALVLLAPGGELQHVTVGGLGDAAVESCVAGVIRGLHFSSKGALELACDFERGEAKPWRLTLDDTWATFDVGEAATLTGGPALDGKHPAAVLASPKAPASRIRDAIALAKDATFVAVAVRGADGVPVWLAESVYDAPRTGIELGATTLAVCGGNDRTVVERNDPHAVDKAMASLAHDSPKISLDGVTASDALALVLAARKAGATDIVLVPQACPESR